MRIALVALCTVAIVGLGCSENPNRQRNNIITGTNNGGGTNNGSMDMGSDASGDAAGDMEVDSGSDMLPDLGCFIETDDQICSRLALNCGVHNLAEVVTFVEQPAHMDELTLSGRKYQFRTIIRDDDGDVLIGADMAETVQNLKAAINLEPGAGTTYGAMTRVNTSIFVHATGPALIIFTDRAGTTVSFDADLDFVTYDSLTSCDITRELTCPNELDVCEDWETCGGADVIGECGCTPETCESLGVLCGPSPDGCQGMLDCDLFCVDSIAAGQEHGCAVGSGKMKCWGENTKGQLGDNTTSQRKNPIDVQMLPSLVESTTCGADHTCIIDDTAALTCWGYNEHGQLGVGTTVDNRLPGDPASIPGNQASTQVVTGLLHSCAIAGGGAYCWGSNTYGQIGDDLFQIGANVAVASLVEGLSQNVTALAAGDYHTCALVDDPANNKVGQVKCWGRGRYGQLGRPPGLGVHPNASTMYYVCGTGAGLLDSATLAREPVFVIDPVTSQPWEGVKAISAGADHTCAIAANDEIYCWGSMINTDPPTCPVFDVNKTARECSVWPGTGFGVASFSPTGNNPCDMNWDPMNDPIADISQYQVAGIAVRPTLVGVAASETPTAIASGGNHTCILVNGAAAGDSNIRCIGNNEFGQIGDGTNNPWPTFRAVFLDVNNNAVTGAQLALGEHFTCTLVNDSNVKCWGSNQKGQIGNTDLARDESYRPFDIRLEYIPPP